MSIETLFLKFSLAISLIVLTSGCCSTERDGPINIRLFELANYGLHYNHVMPADVDMPPSAFVFCEDFRNKYGSFACAPYNRYGPAIATMIVENMSDEFVEVDGFTSESWRMVLHGGRTQRSLPALNIQVIKDINGNVAKISIPPKGKVAHVLGAGEFYEIFNALEEAEVIYDNGEWRACSNRLIFQHAAESVKNVLCLGEHHGGTDTIQTEKDFSPRFEIELLRPSPDALFGKYSPPPLPILVERADADGVEIDETITTKYARGGALLFIANPHNHPISFKSIFGQSWKIKLSMRDGKSRTIDLMSHGCDSANGIWTLNAGESISVLIGTREMLLDIGQVESLYVVYDDGSIRIESKKLTY